MLWCFRSYPGHEDLCGEYPNLNSKDITEKEETAREMGERESVLPSFLKQAGMKRRLVHKMIMLLNEIPQYSCKRLIQGSPAALQMYQMSVSMTQSSGMSSRILKILSHILLFCPRCTGSLMLVFMGRIVLYWVSSDFQGTNADTKSTICAEPQKMYVSYCFASPDKLETLFQYFSLRSVLLCCSLSLNSQVHW